MANDTNTSEKDRASIINGIDLSSWCSRSQHASDLFFFRKIYAKDQALAGLDRAGLQSKFIDQQGHLSYEERWNLISHYINSEQDSRTSILLADFNNRADTAVGEFLDASKGAAVELEKSRNDAWKNRISQI